ncbi:hypothetical protein BGX21_007150 [Mortierella sp. AD011]|nr:hypothetical protein BGX20_007269 [Mortierella sp. AD010]KAF9398875.1 hypothetical protein BGX21_007150 [Mortierella sp. AD011]
MPAASPTSTLLNIPLVVDLISAHLSRQELCICSLVSRDFYIAFSSNIYSSISLQKQTTYDKWERPETQAALAIRSGSIESIKSRFGGAYQLLAQLAQSTSFGFPRLSVLQCGYLPTSPTSLIKNMSYLPSIMSVIEVCPNLRMLELGFFDFRNESVLPKLLSLIRKKGRILQELRIRKFACIRYKYLSSILWSCAAVERLTLDIDLYEIHRRFDRGNELELEAMAREALFGEVGSLSGLPSHLEIHDGKKVDATAGSGLEFAWKELHMPFNMHYNVISLFTILRQCPHLESFTPPEIGSDITQEVLSIFTASTLPRLKHLDLRYVDPSMIGGRSNIPQILDAFSGLKSVVFGTRVAMPIQTVQSLILGSFHSLENLTFVNSLSITTDGIHRILSSCPLLKKFDALVSLHREDAEMSEPLEYNSNRCLDPTLILEPKNIGWVCYGLEILRLNYKNMDGGLYIPVALRKQISMFKNLKDLRLQCISYRENMTGEDGVIEALQEWSTLTDLRTLELRNFGPLLDKEELARIQQQWPKLEWIRFD